MLEEFYDVEADPDCLVNLLYDPKYKNEIKKLRQRLEDWMEDTGDHALVALEGREDPAAVAAYMKRQDEISASRGRGNKRRGNKQRTPKPTKN